MFAVLLGTALLVFAAIGLAGPLDPAPDDVEANTSAETGTPMDETIQNVGLEQEHDVEASADDYVTIRYREEPADVDTREGTASAGGVGPVPEQTADVPAPAADAAEQAGDVSYTATFSSGQNTGMIVDPSEETPLAWSTRDARLAVGISAEDTDDAGGSSNAASISGAPSLGPYYGSSVAPAQEAPPRPDGPTGAPPTTDGGGADTASGSGSGTASTQTTNAAAGLTDVVGVDSPAEAAAVAAAGAVPILVWFLYHRIKGHDVLENETRKAIYDEVCREPGLGVKDLAESADVSYSTASYHLQRLEDADMVVSSKRGKKLCYFQNGGTYDERERELLKVLRNEEAMRVFLDIHGNPGTYRTRIAERLDVSTTTVNWHLDGLVDAGLVRENRDGRTAHLYVDQQRLDDRVRPLLDKTADDDEVEAPAPMTQLRSRLEAPATA